MAHTIEQQFFDELKAELFVDEENKLLNQLFEQYLLTQYRDDITAPAFANFLKEYSIFL